MTNKTSAQRRKTSNGPSLGRSAYSELEEMIITLRLTPGSVISEAMLIQLSKLGRTPMREALQRLERERLLKILPRRGIMVAEINVASQMKLLEVRRHLERPLARVAAQRATQSQRREILKFVDLIQETVQNDDAIRFIRISKEMYAKLIEAAHNEYFESLSLFQGLSRRFWFAHRRSGQDLKILVAAHVVRITAVVDGNAGEAEKATDALMDQLEEFARATLNYPSALHC
ncbi:GntR family transcriptional regulator [Aquamicrobium segne]|uniref:GntR family transcriptional regulator n=1 Tax=Aquamicrobium segne TaxID=469547 RepID=A0ABW0GZS5_9HYPH